MDALALLCNLYGDGPATLRRLREAGCTELVELERLTLDDLTTILGSSPVAARRFQNEATLLAARVVEITEARAEEVDVSIDVGVPRDPAIERALAAWRAADALEVPEQVPEEVVARNDESDEGDGSDGSDGNAVPRATPLRPASVDGLDELTCARLRAFGVETAEDLLAADVLELAAVSECPLTRLMRFQSLIRRALVEETPGLLVPHPRRNEKRFSPDPIAAELRAQSESEPGAGPFA
ncbi:MAG: hypothetical protein K8S98_15890 [Planctomycetes bacterium]|nr:hypothetical protein [Planctomycetota bacterium]